MHDILSDDPAFLSQLYAFISVFNDRFENILRFNMSVDGKYGKQIMSHKQFSLGYLEELDLMTSLIKKFIDNYKYWKTSHKDMIENWIYLICQQTLRIYSSAVDISHSFPPVSEHEIKMSNKIITEFSIQDKKYEYFNKYKQDSPRRSILESIPTRNISENSQKTNKIQPSVFTYRVEATLLSCLTNILSSLIDIIQISRNISLLDPILLLDVGKFCKLLYHKLNQDQNYYKNLERIGNAEYQSAENSLLYGSFNHTYNIDTEKLVDVAQAVFEMSFYLVSKAELSGISDIKSEAGYELEEWKKIASSGTENDDRFIDWLRDEFK